MAERPTPEHQGNSWLYTVTGGFLGAPNTAEVEGGALLTSAKMDDDNVVDHEALVQGATTRLMDAKEQNLPAEDVDSLLKDTVAGVTASMNWIIAERDKEINAVKALQAAYETLDGKYDRKTRVGDKDYHIEKAKLRAEVLAKHVPDTLGAMMAADNLEMAEKLYKVKFKDKALDFAERLPKATYSSIAAAAVAVAAAVDKAVERIKKWWNEPEFVKKRAAVAKFFGELFDKVAKATEPVRTKIAEAARTAKVAIKKGANKVADGFKAAGEKIAAGAKAAGETIAATKIGKSVAAKAKKAGKALAQMSANVKIAVGDKIGDSGRAHYAKKIQKRTREYFGALSGLSEEDKEKISEARAAALQARRDAKTMTPEEANKLAVPRGQRKRPRDQKEQQR